MKYLFIALVTLYRKIISPCFPSCCRFKPTCSEYAIIAFKKHGAIKGLLLAIWRILRCNPFCEGGYDPVPDRFTFKRDNTATEGFELRYENAQAADCCGKSAVALAGDGILCEASAQASQAAGSNAGIISGSPSGEDA